MTYSAVELLCQSEKVRIRRVIEVVLRHSLEMVAVIRLLQGPIQPYVHGSFLRYKFNTKALRDCTI
jgi:hypothetical protein